MTSLLGRLLSLRKHPVPRNAGWLAGERAVSLVVGLAANVVTARYLKSERFGILSYAISVVALLGVFRHLGIPGIVTRDLVRTPHEADELLGTAFAIKVSGGLIALLLAILLAAYAPMPPAARVAVVIVAVGMLFESVSGINYWYQSRLEAHFSIVGTSVGVAASGVLSVVFVISNASLPWFAVAEAGQWIFAAITLVVLYQSQGYRLRNWRVALPRARRLLGESWPLVVSSTVAMLYLKIDQVMLAYMAPVGEVGRYAVAARLSEGWYFLPAILSTSLFPSIVRSKELPAAEYERKLLRMYRLAAGLGLIVAFTVSLVAVPAVRLLYGDEFRGAGPILAVHIWACPAVFMGGILSRWLIAEGFQTFSVTRHLLGSLSNIGLNLVLIPRLGGLGAAIATMISYSIANYFACFTDHRTMIAGRLMTRAILSPSISTSAQ